MLYEILDIASGVLLVGLGLAYIVFSQWSGYKIRRLNKEIEKLQKEQMERKRDYFDMRGLRKGDVFSYGERALRVYDEVEHQDVAYIDLLPCRIFIPKEDWEHYLKTGEVSAILDDIEDNVQERVVEQQG